MRYLAPLYNRYLFSHGDKRLFYDVGVQLIDPESGKRQQSIGEENANSVSHGVAFLAALGAAPFLIRRAAQSEDASAIVGSVIFSAATAFTYLASTLYHALPRGQAKHAFRILEHMAIFVLIAGTYTPFTLSVLRGAWGWSLFGVIWGLALLGIILKAVGGVRYPKLSLSLYIAMGWVVVIAARPLWQRMPHLGFMGIILGGLAYTGGVVFYTLDHRLRYSHFVWHLFVIAGTVIHFLSVYWYATV